MNQKPVKSVAPSSEIQDLLKAHWLDKCSDGRFPSLSEIVPTDIPTVVPHMIFVDVVQDTEGMKLRYRMTGTTGLALSDREVTGQWIHDLYSEEEAAIFVAMVEAVIEVRTPLAFDTHLHSPGREHVGVTVFGCPLASDGNHVDAMILVVEPV